MHRIVPAALCGLLLAITSAQAATVPLPVDPLGDLDPVQPTDEPLFGPQESGVSAPPTFLPQASVLSVGPPADCDGGVYIYSYSVVRNGVLVADVIHAYTQCRGGGYYRETARNSLYGGGARVSSLPAPSAALALGSAVIALVGLRRRRRSSVT